MSKNISFGEFKDEVIDDYKLAYKSRVCSILGRKEVLSGKAKFGIFGDGKELAQIALAKVFKKGDFRSGYYRDQTFMMAIGVLTPQQFFSALYAHTDLKHEPMSGGRQMGGHYATHSVDDAGDWNDLTSQYNISADISCTAGQMPRLLGLAQASKIYRNSKLVNSDNFSKQGNEIAWGTIGDASTSEGVFFEALNASAVMQVPMVTVVWDDGYGISVPKKLQTAKESISEACMGFQRTETEYGIEIVTVSGYDYTELIKTFKEIENLSRAQHVPALIHVENLTQPQGHSTSGSHERYKDETRLRFESDNDCIQKMRKWLIDKQIVEEDRLESIEDKINEEVKQAKINAWNNYTAELIADKQEVLKIIRVVEQNSQNGQFIKLNRKKLEDIRFPTRRDILSVSRRIMYQVLGENTPSMLSLSKWIKEYLNNIQPKYSSHLYSESKRSPLKITPIPASYDSDANKVDGRIILRDNFDELLKRHPQLLIFGEDAGMIGDVNQGLEGLQKKYGKSRVFDTGIREATIVGQAIGMAMRGLRPIVEIQYLDYLLYALYTMSDDLATLHYRTVGRQKAPVIIRTRGHRLEGIFHAGSPMGGIINYLRGIYVLVPRNMTQAAGFYNTLLDGDQPALMIESLNGYRLKETMPSNLGIYKVPIGKVEILKEGSDITMVSYGSTLRIVVEVCNRLKEVGISAEVIDCQTLIPFDLDFDIKKSVQKTNKLLIVDEDVSGGASGYILQQLVVRQKIYDNLDSPPQTLSANDHRTAYSTDGDYFSKPNAEDIFEKAYHIMHEYNPQKFPMLNIQNPKEEL